MVQLKFYAIRSDFPIFGLFTFFEVFYDCTEAVNFREPTHVSRMHSTRIIVYANIEQRQFK